MTGQRARYSADFKAKVALEAIRGELTMAQLVSKHGVHQTMINKINNPWESILLPFIPVTERWKPASQSVMMGGECWPMARVTRGS